MMAGRKSRSDEVKEHDSSQTEERSSLVRDDLPGEKVTDTAPRRTVLGFSAIPDLDLAENKVSALPTESSYSMCSVDQYSKRPSTPGSLSDSQDAEDACAGIVLNCLFCHFYDLCIMLPDTCERAANRVCPSYKYLSAPLEPVHSSDWNCHCDFDCSLFDACHESGECLELAMEISEICYR